MDHQKDEERPYSRKHTVTLKDKRHKERQGQDTAHYKQIMVHKVDMVKPENLHQVLQGGKNK